MLRDRVGMRRRHHLHQSARAGPTRDRWVNRRFHTNNRQYEKWIQVQIPGGLENALCNVLDPLWFALKSICEVRRRRRERWDGLRGRRGRGAHFIASSVARSETDHNIAIMPAKPQRAKFTISAGHLFCVRVGL